MGYYRFEVLAQQEEKKAVASKDKDKIREV